MNKKRHLIRHFLCFVLLCALFAGCKQKIVTIDYQVIPLPKEISLNMDTPFALSDHLFIYYDESDSLRREAEFLAEYLSDILHLDFKVKRMHAKALAVSIHNIRSVLPCSISDTRSESFYFFRFNIRQNTAPGIRASADKDFDEHLPTKPFSFASMANPS